MKRPWRVVLVNGDSIVRWGTYASERRAKEVADEYNARDDHWSGRTYKAEVRGPKAEA